MLPRNNAPVAYSLRLNLLLISFLVTIGIQVICSCSFVGTYVASELISVFCVEKFGTERLLEITDQDLEGRVNEFRELARF